MPNAATAAGTGTPVSGDHTNAIELSGPVVEEPTEPVGEQLGSPEEASDDAVAEDNSEAPPEDVAVPARLKGKSLAQVYQEFSGLEKEYGRQGNELGEARTLLREALKIAIEQQPGAKPSEDLPEPTDEEFDTNPKAAAEKLVKKAVKPLEDKLLTAEQKSLMLEFEAQRPGYQAEVATPEFQAWVQAAPYRMRMFKQAAQFDLEAAGEMFAMWDEVKPKVETLPDKKEAIKRITTETGGSGKSAAGKSGKKIYKSTELARLYTQDRERYNEMAPEIRAAFAEGRVR